MLRFQKKIMKQCCIPEALMFKESRSKFDFDTTVNRVRDSFRQTGWLVPWETDVQGRYMEEGYTEMTKATIIPICRPEGGYNIIKHDKYKKITPLMPLQISVYEKRKEEVYISRMRVKMMSKLMSRITRKNMKHSGQLIETILSEFIEK